MVAVGDENRPSSPSHGRVYFFRWLLLAGDASEKRPASRSRQHEMPEPSCRSRYSTSERCRYPVPSRAWRALLLAMRKRRFERPPYSMFCTCSRILSSSVFSSTTSWASGASLALLPTVFASRPSSCNKKSSRRPTMVSGPADATTL